MTTDALFDTETPAGSGAPVPGLAGHTPTVGDAPEPSAVGSAGRAAGGEASAARPVLEVHVFGQPAPQGSKSAFRNKYTGKIQQVESSKAVKPWREAVKHAALDVLAARHGTTDPFWILDQPVFIYTVFTFVRPKTHYRTGRNAHLLRDDAPAYPCTKNRNDIEKLDRSTRDALTDAGVWTDDSLVAHHDSWKVFAREHPDALPVAGAVIRIYLMGGRA